MTTMTAQEQLSMAIALAVDAHGTQTDKIGDLYIMHPLRVMERVRQAYLPEGVNRDHALQVAVLHDVLEDCDVSGQELLERGFHHDVVTAVQLCTKGHEQEPYVGFVARAMIHPLSRIVKYHDMLDNSDPVRLFKLDPETRDRLMRKYQQGLALYG